MRGTRDALHNPAMLGLLIGNVTSTIGVIAVCRPMFGDTITAALVVANTILAVGACVGAELSHAIRGGRS